MHGAISYGNETNSCTLTYERVLYCKHDIYIYIYCVYIYIYNIYIYIYIYKVRSSQVLQKSRSHLNILETRRVTCSNFHTEVPQIFGAWATWSPRCFFLSSKAKSPSETVGQPVSFGVKPLVGLMSRFSLCIGYYCVSVLGRPF